MSRTVIHQEVDTIEHPLENVWSIVSSFGAIKAWMPSVTFCSTDGQGLGAIRTVGAMAGIVKEKLEVLDHGTNTISYRLVDPLPMPMRGAFGTIRLESKAKDQTKLTWTSDAEEVDSDGAAIIKPVLEHFMKDCLKGLKAALALPPV